MGNPYAPKGETRRSSEMADPLTEFAGRLRHLGATEEEIDEWLEDADTSSAEFRRARSMSDGEIRFAIEAVRGGDDLEQLEQDGDAVTQGVEGIDPAVDAAAHAALDDSTVGHADEIPSEADAGDTGPLPPLGDESYADDAEPLEVDVDSTGEPWVEMPAGLLDETVPEILATVGDDRQLAGAVLEQELLEDEPRKTLVEPLRKLLESDDGAAG